MVEQPLPGAERRQRDRGALGMLERPRPADEQLGGHGGVVGGDAVAIERREREHLVAHRDVGHARPHLLDHAGELVGRDRRQPVDRPRQLVASDRGRVHADERLRGTGSRPLDLLDHELLRTSRSTEPHDAHHAASSSSRRRSGSRPRAGRRTRAGWPGAPRWHCATRRAARPAAHRTSRPRSAQRAHPHRSRRSRCPRRRTRRHRPDAGASRASTRPDRSPRGSPAPRDRRVTGSRAPW